MHDEPRHMTVAVAVIYDPQHGFLLWNNKRWNGYAFPMRHLEAGDQPEQAALDALADRDCPLSVPNATARYLECVGAFGYSEGTRIETYYDYHVIEVDLGAPLNPAALDPDLRFFTYNQLQATSMVTWSSRVVASSLVEFQEVVTSLIWRRTAAGLEFLLVHKPGHGYFFPAVRRKTHAPLDAMAAQAILFDTAYAGQIAAEYAGEAIDVHASPRFGAGWRKYRFYLCLMQFPGVNLNLPGNGLETSLAAFQAAKTAAGQALGAHGYWNWFTVADMHNLPDMSLQVTGIVASAVAAVEEWERRH